MKSNTADNPRPRQQTYATPLPYEEQQQYEQQYDQYEQQQQYVSSAITAAASMPPGSAAAAAAIPLHEHHHHHHDDIVPVNGDAAAVNADFIGNVEQVLEPGLLTNVTSAVAFVEQDDLKEDWYYGGGKKDSVVKQEELVLDSMLQQVRHEITSLDGEAELAIQ